MRNVKKKGAISIELLLGMAVGLMLISAAVVMLNSKTSTVVQKSNNIIQTTVGEKLPTIK